MKRAVNNVHEYNGKIDKEKTARGWAGRKRLKRSYSDIMADIKDRMDGARRLGPSQNRLMSEYFSRCFSADRVGGGGWWSGGEGRRES